MKKTTLLAGAFISALVLLSATDAEEPPQPPQGGSRQNNWNRGNRRNWSNPRADAEAKIKEKFPEEYAQVEKMRADAEAKLRELAKKAGVEIPKTMQEQLAELKVKYPKEMTEIDELRKTDMWAAMRKTQELAEKAGITLNTGRRGGGTPGFGRDNNTDTPPAPRVNQLNLLKQLRERFPAQMSEIDALRKTDPAAARKKMKELSDKLKADQPAETKAEPKNGQK
ncbi:MAG: hypothetical protein LBM70_09215 [Victivallales bacterium]|nr:hypothetical protein [Victivallales bacterium]